MANPAGNYPGRMILVGTLRTGYSAFAYLVTGRSSGSQQRYATAFREDERAIRILPTDPNAPFDPLRHYRAVHITNHGLAVISNSDAPVLGATQCYVIAQEALCMDGDPLRHVLSRHGNEQDHPTDASKHTPRIMGVVMPATAKRTSCSVLGIARDKGFAKTFSVHGAPRGLFWAVPTYDGEVEYSPFNTDRLGRLQLEMGATSAQELAEELYEMTDHVDPKYGELRVCAVAGAQNSNGPGGWELGRKNRHEVK